MNQNPQIMTGYNYHQPPHGYVQENIHPNTTNNILFVADLSDDITEEDLSLFFKDYQFKVAKVYK